MKPKKSQSNPTQRQDIWNIALIDCIESKTKKNLMKSTRYFLKLTKGIVNRSRPSIITK